MIRPPRRAGRDGPGGRRSGKVPDGPGTPRPLGPGADPESHVGRPVRPGKDPAVAGEGAPGVGLPQGDDRQVHRLADVGPDGEPPQDVPGPDQAGDLGHPAGGPVRPDDEVGPQFVPRRVVVGALSPVGVRPPDHESRQAARGPERAARPALVGDCAGVERRRPEDVVEDRARDGPGTARVGDPVDAGEEHPATRRSHHHHVAQVGAGRFGHPQIGHDLEGPGPDDVPARLVPGEPGLVHQGHRGTRSGQHQCCRAARRSGAHDEDIDVPLPHTRPPDAHRLR